MSHDPLLAVLGLTALASLSTPTTFAPTVDRGAVRIAAAALPSTPGIGDLAIDSGASNALKWWNGTAWQASGGNTTISAPGLLSYSYAGTTFTALALQHPLPLGSGIACFDVGVSGTVLKTGTTGQVLACTGISTYGFVTLSGITGSAVAGKLMLGASSSSVVASSVLGTYDSIELAIEPAARTSGAAPKVIWFIGASHTNLAASGEVLDFYLDSARTVQRLAGNVSQQRTFMINAPTFSFTGASTIALACTMSINNAPVAGTNATITRSVGLLSTAPIMVRAAASQDAVIIEGRAGGTNSYAVTIAPTTLGANRSITLPDTSGMVTVNLGVPSAEASNRTLTDSDNSKNLICSGTRVFTVNTGLVSGFGCSFKGTVSFTGTATVTDVRTTGATNPWCELRQTGTDTYDIVGSKA